MTDCALAAPARHTRSSTVRTRRHRPRGVPRWMWVFGVTVVPLSRDRRADGTDNGAMDRVWVLSAGAGTTHVAALVHDEPLD
jgi:hypothetical protein